MCVDCRSINKIILTYLHPISRLDDMIDELNDYCVFSKMAHFCPCHKCDDASNVTSLFDENFVKFFKYPLWCDDTLANDGILFYENDSTFIGKGSVKVEDDAYVFRVTSSLSVPMFQMSHDSLISKVKSWFPNI